MSAELRVMRDFRCHRSSLQKASFNAVISSLVLNSINLDLFWPSTWLDSFALLNFHAERSSFARLARYCGLRTNCGLHIVENLHDLFILGRLTVINEVEVILYIRE
jgi:hypothetical protein